MTVNGTRVTELSTTLSTDIPRGCGCPVCQNDSGTVHQDGTPFFDLAVLPGGGGTVTPPSIGLNNAGELLSGNEWGPGGGVAANVSYSFLNAVPSYYASNAQERTNFQPFTESMKDAVRDILDSIESFANVTFSEVNGVGDITYGQAWLTSANSDPGAWAYYPDQGSFSGDVWTNIKYASATQNVTVGTYGFFTLMHETGHALGLQHSFTAGLTGAENTEQFTVMAYDWSTWGSSQYAESYMLYDIAALQEIYGANTAYNAGDTVYNISYDSPQTLWDAGGADTINTSSVSADVIIHLEEGGFSSIGDANTLAIAYGTQIEKAVTGGGDDSLYGNGANNVLTGGGGDDNYYGQAGNDTYFFTSGQDAVTETTGIDTVSFDAVWDPGDVAVAGDILTLISSVNRITFNDIDLIEFFSFAGYAAMTLDELLSFGIVTDDVFTGTSAMEIFNGGDGSDTVDYSTSPLEVKVDLLKGTASSGFAEGDTLVSIENVTGSDAASKRDTLYGDNQQNTLNGLAGNDILEGDGGGDTIDGGPGFDYARYTRSSSAVHINLETNIHTGGDAQGDQLFNIEAVTGSSHNDSLRGDAGNNYLRGENGSDTLYAGYGYDQLHGGNGSDLFVLQDIGGGGPADRILDFSLGQGDKIDISDLLSGFDPLSDSIEDFVRITDSGANSFLAVDQDGGGSSYLMVSVLLNVTGLTDEADLLSGGTLIAV